MKKHLYMLLILVFATSNFLFAQDNLKVEFLDLTTVPDFLNICGDSDNETVLVSLDGLDNQERQNIIATAQLFEGVIFESFDPSNSTAGVSLISAADPTAPVFGLPNMQPGSIENVEIAFSVSAKCEYLDTITANNLAVVNDLWSFAYNMGGSSLTEDDLNQEYRDAFAVPSFTIDVVNTNGPAAVGECYTRDLVVTNSGLDGFVDTIVYENAQGAGVYISGVEVNGIPLTLNKVLDVPSGDTIITGYIDSTFFKLNTIGPSLPGNGDNFFDSNETVTITETACLVDCTLSRASIHQSSWGCSGRFCNSVSIPDFVATGAGAANVIATRGGSIAEQNTGYCQEGTITFTITNDGVELDPGFATMLDIATGVTMGPLLALLDNGYQINSLNIAGRDIPGFMTINQLEGDPLFATDPDVGGLSDFDLDGYFDDLELNQSFEVSATYEFDCTQAQQLGADLSCANEFFTDIGLAVDFTDLCQNRIPSGNTFLGMYTPSNTRSSEVNATDPDAFVETDTFYISHTQSRAINNFDKNCSGNEEFKAYLVLPMGITPIIAQTTLIKDEGAAFPMTSNFISNDTLYLVFDASISPFISGSYELVFALQADCTADRGATSFPAQFSFNCPEGGCNCEHIWYCGEIQGPQLHATNPPCVDVSCPIGLRTTDFDVVRTTFGYTDTSYTVAFDPSMANKKVAIACDSIQMTVMNLVGDTPINDSIGMVITYDNIDGSLSSDETFLFDYGTLRITNAGSEYFCTVQPDVLTTVAIDSSKQLTFDLDSCLVDLGITLVAGDTVEFVANFGLNPNGPYLVNFKSVPNLRAYGYGRFNGTDFACDNFGDDFTIAKTQSVFNIPNSINYPEGCEETFLEYKILTTNNGFSDWFGDEYRQSVKIDSITFAFDTSFWNAFTIFEPEVFIRNHPVHGNSYFPAPAFELFPDGNYVAAYDTLTGVPALNTAQGVTPVFNFRIRLIPNCKSQTSSINGDNFFQLDPSIYFTDKYYANNIGDGSCTEYYTESQNRNVEYENPPELTFTPLTNPNFTLEADTAVWVVQLCNISFTSAAGLTWIAVEDSNSMIDIVSIEDITDPMNETQLTVSPFGSSGNNYFAYADGLSKADGSATLDEICNFLRITGVVNRCGSTGLTARVGWSCVAFEEPAWTPELYPPCEDMTLELSATTLDVDLQADIDEQPMIPPSICDTITIAIEVRNTQRGRALDIRSQIILPFMGAQFVPGSFEVAYPSSAPYVSVPTDPTFVGTSSRGRVYEYSDFSLLNAELDANGLLGFNTLNPSIDSNEFKIRYKFVTDCDFVSGSLSYFNFSGFHVCGDPTNIESGETLPLTISGAEPNPSKMFDISFPNQTGLFPGELNNLSIQVVNTGTAVTDSSDKVRMRIPLDLEYNLGSSTVEQPLSWLIEEPTIDTVDGYQIVYWCLPEGIPANDTMAFNFDLNVPDYGCSVSNLELELFTISVRELLCAAAATLCNVELITSTNIGSLTNLMIFQNNLNFDLSAYHAVTSACLNSTQELVLVNGNLIYTGDPFPASPVTIRYHYDVNANDDYDIGELELAAFTFNGPFVNGDVIPLVHSFPVDVNQVCAIIASVDTTGLDLCSAGVVPLREIPLINVGDDQLFCENTATIINTSIGDGNCNALSSYTYNWIAIPPASLTDLSDPSVPDPGLLFSHDGITEDTLFYVLETTRTGCTSVNYDTINIIRGVTVDIDPGLPIMINAGDTALLSPSIMGSSAFFTYEWSPAATLNDNSIANPQAFPLVNTTYYVTVTSAVGCSDIDSIQVLVDQGLNADIFVINPSVCETDDIQLFASGGTDYLWEANPSNPAGGSLSDVNIPNPIFSGGINGSVYDYYVIVTDSTLIGVVDTAFISLTIDNQYCDCEAATLNSVIITEATCGNFDGAATISLVEDPANFTYVWTPDLGTSIGSGNTRIDLYSGGYFVRITETADPSCVTDVYIAVSNEDAPDAQGFVTDATCEASDGKATMFPSEYTYFWPDGFIGDDRADLSPGTYFVSVTEQSNPNCPNVIPVVIDSVNPLSATVSVNAQPDCAVANGSVTINVNGGSGDYVYSWPGATDTNSDLSAGVYMVTVIDTSSTLCELVVPFTLTDNVPPATVAVTDTTHITCNGSSNGSFIYSVGLDAAFVGTETIIITNGTDTVNNANLPAGNYCVQVYDGNGCFAGGACVELTQPDPLSVVYVTTRDCGTPGTISTLVTGGTPPFTYLWQDVVGMPDLADRVDLSQGIYPSIVQDSKGCSILENVPISGCPCEEILINGTVVTQTTCGNSVGIGEILLEGDPSLYGYNWTPDIGTPGATGNIRSGLPFGVYQVEIFNLNSPDCITEYFVVISNMDGPTATYTSTPATCELDNGTVSLMPANYDYSWNDGITGADRTDLFAGTYFVTIIDPSEPDCPNVMEVVVGQDNPLAVIIVVNTQPDCMQANGSVTLNVTGGSGNYEYSWPSNTDTQDSLAAGVYVITVTDTDSTGCSLPVIFVLTDNVPPATINISDTMHVSCAGAADGAIVYDITFDAAFTAPADTIITDGYTEYTNGNLPGGDYCMEILDGNGCVAGGICFRIQEPDPLNVDFLIDPDCDEDGMISITTTGGTEPYTYDWADLVGTDDMEDRMTLAAGFYQLTISDANACSFEEDVEVIVCPYPDTCNYFNGFDNLNIQIFGCETGELAEICLDIAPIDRLDYIIYDNGLVYNGAVNGCEIDTGYLYVYNKLAGNGFIGPYNLNSWTINSTTYIGPFNDLYGLVDSMNVWDPTGNWILNDTIPSITGGNPSNTYSAQVIQNSSGTPQTIGGNFFTFANSISIQVDEGTHELIVIDTIGRCADTLMANVVCTTVDTIPIVIFEGQMDTLCLNSMDLFGDIDTIYNICELENVSMTVLSDSCVVFTGLTVGLDTACLVVCDTLGLCDTTIVTITVLPLGNLNPGDTVCIATFGNYIFDPADINLAGPITSMTNICEDSTGQIVEFFTDEITLTLNYIGASVGTETACIEFCDATACDTINFTVEVLSCTNSQWVIDTIFINQNEIYCIDSTEFSGQLTTIENICPEQSGTEVEFFLNPETLCVEYNGLEIGKDTACVVVCDENLICDTTYFCVLVIEYFEKPIANDDYDTTSIGTPVVIDIKANDILFGGIDTAYILDPPLYGTIGIPGNPNSINLDCSVTYNASDEFCEREDQFTYVVCTPNGCDTATVYVWLECIDIVIFTAVSPNGDGSNDEFFISGIFDYPDNELAIYNRWGNLVYETSGYKNEWRGTWNGNKNLPDGTYFYILKLNDDENRIFRGFIEMYR